MPQFDTGRSPSTPDNPTRKAPDESGTPGKVTLTTPALPRTTHDLHSHAQPLSRFRNPDDEVQVRWPELVQMYPPGDLPREIVPDIACPKPHEGVPAQSGAQPCHDQGAPALRAFTPPTQVIPIPQGKVDERQGWWFAYYQAAKLVDGTQRNVAEQLKRIHDPSHDADVEALGYEWPARFQGTVMDLTSAQRVPNRSGMPIEALFTSRNTIASGAGEQHRIRALATSGKGDSVFRRTAGADSALHAAMHRLSAALLRADAAGQALQAAQARLTKVEADHKATATEKAITELKEGPEAIASVIEWLTNTPKKVMGLVKGLLDDPTQLGVASTLALRSLPIEGMQAATARLRQARATSADAEIQAAVAAREDAKLTAAATVEEVAAAKDDVSKALNARRGAYDDAAVAAGDPRLGAYLSAKPLVEFLVAILYRIVEDTRNPCPPCDDAAAYGYGIAMKHAYPEAVLLPYVIGQLMACHVYYADLYWIWLERLAALNTIIEHITAHHSAGARA